MSEVRSPAQMAASAAFMLLAAAAGRTRSDLSGGAHRSSIALNGRERLLAGGSARFGAQLVMYPADALRTLAQTRSGAKTLNELGVGTLVSGCFTTSTFAFAIGGLQFCIFGALRPSAGPLLASACASLGSCFAGVPQEVIKQRLVTGIYPNFPAAVSSIWRAEGVLGFYSGWAPTVSRNLPFVVITFCSFDALQRRLLRDRPPSAALTTAENLLAGVSSALFGGLCTQPVDVVKTRLMTQAAVPGVAPYAGVADCVRTMAAAEVSACQGRQACFARAHFADGPLACPVPRRPMER